MFEYAEERGINNVFFCGDFFHTHGNLKTEVLDAACDAFERGSQNLNFFFLVGNHDMADREGHVHSLKFLKRFGQVVDSPTRYFFPPGVPVFMMPYTEDKDKLQQLLDHTEENSIVLLHQGVQNVPVNSKGFVLAGEIFSLDMIPSHVSHVFLGHYHSHKRMDKATIVGTPLHLTWSDEGERRGWLDVTVEKGEVEILHIESEAPKFISINSSDKIEGTKGNFVRLIMDGNTDVNTDELEARSVELCSPKKEEDRQELDKKIDLEPLAVFEEFVKTHKMEGRMLEVGQEIVSNTYETPQDQDT
jgi:DNA repair exonuclease SbcCD nuclease subunit